MADKEYRLGDTIDDYCPRCRLLLNHAVASMLEEKVMKVICNTCHNEHPFRYGQGGKDKKLPGPRPTLFEQVLARTSPTSDSSADVPEKKKKTGAAARYISRHKTRPPRRGH